MAFLRSSALLLLCVLFACSGSGNVCRNVTCAQNRICDPESGACIPDLNPKDAGFVDAGTEDAGVDAGMTVDAGAMCPPGCADAGQVCDPVSVKCVQCVGNAQCGCPRGLCDLATHSCVLEPALVQPIGESCADAKLLAFPICSPSLTRFQVDLGALTDNEKGTCSLAGGMGRDAVFILNVPTVSDVRVTTSQAQGSTAQAVTYLRVSPCATGMELVCRDSFGAPSNFRAKALAPGVYALVIDAFDQASSGVVDVMVELVPTVTNDTCSTPLDAPTDGGSVSVDLSGAADDLVGSCNTTAVDSRDTVWRVTLNQRSHFDAVVRALIPDAGIDSVVYLRAAPCASGAELACEDSNSSQPEHLSVRSLDAGTYFLVVEGYGTQGSGPVELTSWATPAPVPPNDTCASPRLLDFTSTDSVRFTVDTSEAQNDEKGTCSTASGGGPDLVYRFTLPAARTVTITSRSADGGLAVDPVIYLRQGGCAADAGTELGCADDVGVPEVLFNSLPAGQYYLVVDSYSSSSAGPTLVTVTLSP